MSFHIDSHPRKAQSRFRRPSVACQSCGGNLPTGKHTGRKRLFCSDTCKDAHRRQLNFEFFGSTAHGQAKPRNAKNPSTKSNGHKVDFAGRESGIHAPRRIIEAELGRDWVEGTSTDGIQYQVRQLKPRALRNGGAA